MCIRDRGIRVAVCKGQIRLDIVNGRPVHKVCAGNMEHRPPVRVKLHGIQLHGGKPHRIGPEGGPGGKNAHPRISSQPGGPHRRGPFLPDSPGKFPDEPQVGKLLNAPQGIRIPVLRLKNDLRLQIRDQAALARDPELDVYKRQVFILLIIPSGGIKRPDLCGKRRNQMRNGIMSMILYHCLITL